MYAQDNNSLPVWIIFVTSSPPYLHQFSTISGGNCIRLTVSSFDSQANQSNQSPIQRELLMPSPEVIDLTLSDNLMPFDQIKEPLRLPEQQIGSEHVPQHPPHPASTELGEFFQSFKVLLQPSNELKIISHSNLSSTTLTLDKHSSTASTGLVYLTSTLWRPASTHTLKTDLSQKRLTKIPRPRITPSSTSDSRVRLLPSPLTTKTSLKGCFPHPSLKLETF